MISHALVVETEYPAVHGPSSRGVLLEGLGVRARFRSHDLTLVDRLRDRLPPDWSVIEGDDCAGADLEISVPVNGDGHSRIEVDGRLVTVARDASQLTGELEHRLLIAMATRTTLGVPLHAGLVSYRGRGLLLPGRSASGKSTLVDALVAAGARYESDDLVLVTPGARAIGVARPLSLRSGLGRQRRSPAALGWCSSETVSVAEVAFLQFRRGTKTRLERLGAGAGTLEAFRHSMTARQHPEQNLSALASLCARAIVHRGVRGEASLAAELLLDRLRGALCP